MPIYVASLELSDGEFDYSAHRTKSGALRELKRMLASHLYPSLDAHDAGFEPMEISELREFYEERHSLNLEIREVKLKN